MKLDHLTPHIFFIDNSHVMLDCKDRVVLLENEAVAGSLSKAIYDSVESAGMDKGAQAALQYIVALGVKKRTIEVELPPVSICSIGGSLTSSIHLSLAQKLKNKPEAKINILLLNSIFEESLNGTIMSDPSRWWIPVCFDGAKCRIGPFLQNVDHWRQYITKSKLKHPASRLSPRIKKMTGLEDSLFLSPAEIDLITNLIQRELFHAFSTARSSGSIKDCIKTFDFTDYTYCAHAYYLEENKPIEKVEFDFMAPHFQASGVDSIVHEDGGFRVVPAIVTVQKLIPHFGGEAGILPLPEEDYVVNGDFFVHTSSLGDAVNLSKKYTFSSLNSCGKGSSYLQSKASCLAEAVERYCMYTARAQNFYRGPHSVIFERAYQPEQLEAFGAKQREGAIRFVVEPSREYGTQIYPLYNDEIINWVPAHSLTDKSTYWLPYSYCYPEADEVSQLRDPYHCTYSNGFSAGNTPEEAIIQGALELIERDQTGIWWFNKLIVDRVDLASFENKMFNKNMEYFQSRSMQVVVLDLTLDFDLVSTFVAVLIDKKNKIFRIGRGAHFSAEVAIERALSEVHQAILGDSRLLVSDVVASDEGLDYLTSFRKVKTRVDYEKFKIQNMSDALNILRDEFKNKDLNFLILDYSQPRFRDFYVYRSIVPGLVNTLPRFGNLRLYELPVKMGFLNTPRTELELNRVVM